MTIRLHPVQAITFATAALAIAVPLAAARASHDSSASTTSNNSTASNGSTSSSSGAPHTVDSPDGGGSSCAFCWS